MIRDRPDGFRAQWHMARVARKNGDVALALAQYEKAMKLWPYREGLALEAAVYASSKGNTAWARNLSLFGTQRWPDNPAFFNMLAAASIDMGDSLTARRVVADGLRIHPDNKILNDMWRAFGQPRGAR
jgi:predicted Zn-dependent protease